MAKYVIDNSYFSEGLKLYSLEDALSIKKPKLRKYMGRQDRAQARIIETWKHLGPLIKMKDKVGHRFHTILLRNMKNVFGDSIKLRLLRGDEATTFNKKYYPQGLSGAARNNKIESPDTKKEQHTSKKFRSAVTEMKKDLSAARRAAGNSSPTKMNFDDKN